METLIHSHEPVKTSTPVFFNESRDVFVTVEGDSMIDSFIPSKALLLVDRLASARSGDIIVAVLNGEFTVKRLLKTHVGTFLSPANPNYKPVKITKEMNFEVWGVVSRIIIDPKDV